MAKGRIRAAIKKKLSTTKAKPAEGLKSVQLNLEKLDAKRKLFQFRINRFEPKHKVEFKKGHYTVKTATEVEELEELLQLRFRIFHKEFKQKRRSYGVDVDQLDLVCDHLMIRDDRTGKIVGTYRLNLGSISRIFYSEAEFEMKSITELPGLLLELGRAGIEKEYRTGIVIALLWRGLSAYLDISKADYMLGCASVRTTDLHETARIHDYLMRKNALATDHQVRPTKKYSMKDLDSEFKRVQVARQSLSETEAIEWDQKIEQMIPALFHSYLKMGVKVYGLPALDAEYNCIDYLIMTAVDQIDPAYRKRFEAGTPSGQNSSSESN